MNLPKNYERVASVVEILSATKAPALSPYDLGKLLYKSGALSPSTSLKHEYDALLETILGLHLLTPLGIAGAFLLFGRASATAGEIACSIDPFSYVSHLSAMEHHGLTDRFLKTLYMTRPSPPVWKKQAEERMKKDLGDEFESYTSSKLPLLVRPKLDVIGRTTIHFQERSQLGAFRHVSDTSLRVATIGRVFLDMVREAKFCGGIQHVIDVYKREAKRYLKFIIDEIDRHGDPIDKVRAGYLLTEVCGLDDPAFTIWKSFAQRGGSRKLDPEEDYATHYSERWKLSLNVPSLSIDPEFDDV